MITGTIRSAALTTVVLLISIHATAGESKVDQLTSCSNASCVRDLIPRETRVKFDEKACKSLDGKQSSGIGTDSGADLGFVCRLALARNRATYRKDAPCIGTSDIDPGLGQTFLRTFYNQAGWSTVDGRPVERLPDSYGTGPSEAFGSTVFEREFRFKDEAGEAREATYVTFFCITDKPRRYVPYFHALKVDGLVRNSAAISNPPHTNERVMSQLGNFEPEYVKSAEFVDLNRDGIKDLLVLSDHVTRGYSITACVYRKDSPSCQVIGPSQPQIPPSGVVSAKISRDKAGLNLTMSDERDQAVAQIRYKINGSVLESGVDGRKSTVIADEAEPKRGPASERSP